VRLALAGFALLALAGQAQAHQAFNPVEFFRGRSHGNGVLKIIFQSSKTISVDSEGWTEKDHSLTLKQVIHEPGKPPRVRFWRLRQTGPDRFDGTLTDADSPVRVDVQGDQVRIRYHGKDKLNFDQLLTPVGPREVHNSMSVRRLGFTVAHFEETIRKLD
jgi:hypothetical protein